MIMPLEKKNILFGVTANGDFDMGADKDFLAGSVKDHQFPAGSVAVALQNTPKQYQQDGK